MKLKYPSSTQIPFKFDNFKKRDFDSFFQGENKDLLYFLNTMIKTRSNNSWHVIYIYRLRFVFK